MNSIKDTTVGGSLKDTVQTAELKEKGLFGSDGGVENPTTMPDLQNKLK